MSPPRLPFLCLLCGYIPAFRLHFTSLPFLCALCALCGYIPRAIAQEAPFPDKNLEAAVREVLHEPKEKLTDEKLANVYVLESTGKGIHDLAGLEKCKNLALLKLSNQKISDLKPLKDLVNLQSLDLSGNRIADIAPLHGLSSLQYIELSNNEITDVQPLKGLKSLSARLSCREQDQRHPAARRPLATGVSVARSQ